MNLNTKLQKVLSYLTSNGAITKKDMMDKCFYSNGGDAIMKLRNTGHNIVRSWDKTSSGARYARYTLLAEAA